MKKEGYTEMICRGFCSFYRGGKEELTCGTYDFLVRNLSPQEVRPLTEGSTPAPDFSHDNEIKSLICDGCDFITNGCDFREGLDSPPCGGYVLVESLMKRNTPAG